MNRKALVATSVLLAIVITAVAALRVTVVDGDSMLPSYRNGDIVLVLQARWLRSQPKRGDVVLIRRGHDVLIKRVAHVAGEVMTSIEARPFRTVADYFDQPRRAPRGSLAVPPGTLTVLGDNRDVSEDSRAFGPVPLRDLLGRVLGAPPG